MCWDESIKALEERAVELEALAQKAKTAAQLLREISCEKKAAATKQGSIRPAPPARQLQDKRTNKRDGRCAPRKPKPGKLKGVTEVKYKKGPSKYRACYWDGPNKKNVKIGIFDSDLEAALAVAKQLSDAAEVQRLGDLMEQKENNPNRPGSKAPVRKDGQHKYPHKQKTAVPPVDKPPGEKIETYYQCDNCHIEYQTKPNSCIQCHGASFTKRQRTPIV